MSTSTKQQEAIILCQMVLAALATAVTLPIHVNYTIAEEQAAGIILGNVKTDGRLAKFYDGGAMEQLRFFTLDGSTPAEKWVRRLIEVDRATGSVKLTTRPDREQLCPLQLQCQGHVDVALGPAQYSGRLVRIHVSVVDINDHAPSFSTASENLLVPEELPIGSRLYVPEAEDSDVGEFGIVRYEIVPMEGAEEGMFDVAVNDRGGIALELKRSLDRETAPIVTVAIVAHDGGGSSNSASLVVNMTLQDANDNAPAFALSAYSFPVPEDAVRGTVLGHVNVSDLDIGSNGHVTLSFDKTTSQLYGSVFALDPHVGTLTLLQAIDYETLPSYQLVVKAADGGSSPLVSYANVIVDVIDVNDNAPLITVNTLRDDGAAIVTENLGASAFVAYVSASDQDSGDNGRVTCVLGDLDNFELVAQSAGQYKVLTTRDFDREAQKSYTVDISCHDNGTPRHVTNVTSQVTVADVNDNSPHFAQLAPVFYIPEGSRIGSIVGRLTATDADEGDNGRVTYRTRDASGADSALAVDYKTGVIETSKTLDYEMTRSLELVVEAVDSGQPALTSAALVRVVLLDINDERPTFAQDAYTFVISENLPAGTTVGRLLATDPDSPPNNEITYRLRNARPPSAERLFTVNSQGALTTLDMLDRETASAYTLVIEAADSHKPELASVTTVTVYVTDVNDNSPVIHFPSDVNQSVSISSRMPVGSVVARIVAKDADAGDNAALRYNVSARGIDSVITSSLFRCDAATGNVIVNGDLKRIDYAIVNLTVQVTDGAKDATQRNATAVLTVIVNSSIEAPLLPNRSSRTFHQSASAIGSYTNTIAIICVVSATGVIIAILLAAIALIACRNNHLPVDQLLITRNGDYAKQDDHLYATAFKEGGKILPAGCPPPYQAQQCYMMPHHSLLTAVDSNRTALSIGRPVETYNEKRVSFRDYKNTVPIPHQDGYSGSCATFAAPHNGVSQVNAKGRLATNKAVRQDHSTLSVDETGSSEEASSGDSGQGTSDDGDVIVASNPDVVRASLSSDHAMLERNYPMQQQQHKIYPAAMILPLSPSHSIDSRLSSANFGRGREPCNSCRSLDGHQYGQPQAAAYTTNLPSIHVSSLAAQQQQQQQQMAVNAQAPKPTLRTVKAKDKSKRSADVSCSSPSPSVSGCSSITDVCSNSSIQPCLCRSSANQSSAPTTPAPAPAATAGVHSGHGQQQTSSGSQSTNHPLGDTSSVKSADSSSRVADGASVADTACSREDIV